MNCIVWAQSYKLVPSRWQNVQQLQQKHARLVSHLKSNYVSRLKVRPKAPGTVASLPTSSKQQELHIGQSPSAPQQALQSSALQQKPLIAAVAGAALLLVFLLRALSRKSRPHTKQSAGTQNAEPEHAADSKDFKAAVARTRQAVSVQKAIGFMDASSPAKAIVELRRALEENSVARASILNMRYQSQDLLNLYKLHLQNTEMPANFATLLQLREMLAISELDAERIEKEVYESGAAFSI